MKKKEQRKTSQEEKFLLVEKAANELLDLMGTKASAKASEDKENEAIRVEIQSEDETGLLIGKKGETLNAIQAALGMILRQKRGEWQRIIVNIGDYLAKQEDYLRNLAKDTAERAKSTGQPQPLYNLTAAQRRIIHLELANESDVLTESVGEEPERYLVVKPKK